MTRSLLSTLALSTVLLTTGCDELLLYDVGPDGRILAPVDAGGRVAAFGDAGTPRHLVRLDPQTGKLERLTAAPLLLSSPRACGAGATWIEGRRRLVHLPAAGHEPRVLFESERLLIQACPSPSTERVALFEADRLGLPGTLHVIDVAGGELRLQLEGVVPGFTWAGESLVLARIPVAGPEPFQGGEGEVLLVRGGERRTLFRGMLAGATWFAPGKSSVLAVTRPGSPLALLPLKGRDPAEEGERSPTVDLWPTFHTDGRVLFTRAAPDASVLEGELRLARAGVLAASVAVPTPGLVKAPRWVRGDLVAYLTPDDRLFTQKADGSAVVDWTDQLRAAAGGAP